MADVVGRGQGWGGGSGGGGGRGRGGGRSGGRGRGGGVGREWGGGGGGCEGPGAGGRGRGRRRGHGLGGPNVDPLLDNHYLAFEDRSEAFHRCEKFWQMEIGGHAAVDWTTPEGVDEAARARDYIGHDTPLFLLAYLSSYRVMVCEFLASFEFTPRPADKPEEDEDPKHRFIAKSIHRASRDASGVIKGICFICFVLYEGRRAPSITA
ncbi:hypothetical protein Hanom_Chr17g01545241 [Helianthus anomalus]